MSKNLLLKIGLIVLPIIFSLSCARSTVLLRGDDAEEYLAKNYHLIAPGQYTFGAARNRQNDVLMVAVFNRDRGGKDDGNFTFLRREKNMGYHTSSNPYNVILLNSPQGKRGAEPTNETLAEIRKNNLSPVIVLNAEGGEEAVVYKPARESLVAFLRDDNVIRLEIGQRTQSQGDIAYYISFKDVLKPPKETHGETPQKRKKKKEIMSEIKVGDLVQWETGAKTRVGVVKAVNPDGTSIINVPPTEGSREEKIKTERLEVITSTIETDQ